MYFLKIVISNPNFNPQEMKSINLAAKSLCEWIHAVNNFIEVFREINIKKENCKQMDITLQEANQKLDIKQKELDEVISKLNNL